MPELVEYAARFGLTAEMGSRVTGGGDMFVIAVERSPEAGQWSMASTEIALAKTVDVAVEQAKIALDRMRPRLEKQLAQLPEPIEDDERLRPSVGVASDGVVSVLRVERDGTVRLAYEDMLLIADAVFDRLVAPNGYRLSSEDIEAIVEAVTRKLRPRKVKITNGP